MGAISELQVAEVLIANQHVTVGFDTTTQEGTHVNEIHFTTGNECLSAAVDELAGGTAVDYSRHICETVDSLAHTFVHFHENSTFPDTRMKLTNSMSDRCATNHATIRLVNTQWGKTLNEMNCHLHPLDSFATSCRSALKSLEDTTGNVFGRDCLAANFVLGMNKLRYKDGKGDPRGFVTFLDRCNLPRGILPRHRGNRLHILFHNAGVLIEHQDTFAKLLKVGTTLGGLRSSLEKDFRNEDTLCELQVLGLLGKHLTGPWMTKFYTAADTEISHVDGINIVKASRDSEANDAELAHDHPLDQRFLRTGSCVEQCSQVESVAILSPFLCHDEILPPSLGRCSSTPVCKVLHPGH